MGCPWQVWHPLASDTLACVILRYGSALWRLPASSLFLTSVLPCGLPQDVQLPMAVVLLPFQHSMQIIQCLCCKGHIAVQDQHKGRCLPRRDASVNLLKPVFPG